MDLPQILQIAENGAGLVAILLLVWRVDGRLEQVRVLLERLSTLMETEIGHRRRDDRDG